MKKLSREEFIERVAHMITSGSIPDTLFEYYFKDTDVGHMNQGDVIELLKGDEV